MQSKKKGTNDTHDPIALGQLNYISLPDFFLFFCGHSSRFARDGNLIIDPAALDDDNRPL
jgi:hypothetical protein